MPRARSSFNPLRSSCEIVILQDASLTVILREALRPKDLRTSVRFFATLRMNRPFLLKPISDPRPAMPGY